MIYLDTCFLAPCYVRESTSEGVEEVLLRLSPQELGISDWTVVEFASLLSRRVRMGELGVELMQAIMRSFRADVDHSCNVFAVTRADFHLAAELILDWESGLRAGDALHLAIAQNSQVSNFLSLDRNLISAAHHFGLPADSGGLL